MLLASLSKKTQNRLIHFLHGAGLTSCAFLLPAHSYIQHTRSCLLHVHSLHPISSGTDGGELQCRGRPCELEPLWSSQDVQDSSGIHNLPTRLPVHPWSTQETSLEISLVFGEATTPLQLHVEISSSILLGHSSVLLCLSGLKM